MKSLITIFFTLFISFFSFSQDLLDLKIKDKTGSIKVWNQYTSADLGNPYAPENITNVSLISNGNNLNNYFSYKSFIGINNNISLPIAANIGAFGLLNSISANSYSSAVYGEHSTARSNWAYGVFGEAKNHPDNANYLYGDYYGVMGKASGVGANAVNYGIYGITNNTNNTSYAGYFSGKVHVNGTLSKSAGTFKIDHPLDPQNKYLSHSFVESPDMMNIYNGNTITGNNGKAVVTLPSYFEALNIDFRYQLTTIGGFANLTVLEEIHGNQFIIASDKPNVKISWQVTGIRNDAYARKNRVVPEEDKSEKEKGKYLNADAFGLPREESIHAVKSSQN